MRALKEALWSALQHLEISKPTATSGCSMQVRWPSLLVFFDPMLAEAGL